MQKLLIATTNQAKLREIREFLNGLPIELVSLQDVGITQTVSETGQTLEENAILKAKEYSRLSGLAALADDGGFEIDALKGEPGIKSHRWIDATRENTDEELIQYALQRLKDVPIEKRGAQLRLVLAFSLLNGKTFTVEETDRGIIPLEITAKREKGFPYRSLLYFPEIQRFYVELGPEHLVKYNHRKRAVEKMRHIISENLL